MPENQNVYQVCLEAVHSELVDEGFEDLASNEIQITAHPWEDDRMIMGMTITKRTPREGQGSTQRDAWFYPCVITYVVGSARETVEGETDLTLIRKKITRRFHNKRIPMTGLTSGDLPSHCSRYTCKVTEGQITIPDEVETDNLDMTTMIVWVGVLEGRELIV
ncbi:MAG: hypothetical protein KDD44_14870 [Bdellovibrionales bacterium]|nr:hypothetical protein [Bdellovibrionales bacterium]